MYALYSLTFVQSIIPSFLPVPFFLSPVKIQSRDIRRGTFRDCFVLYCLFYGTRVALLNREDVSKSCAESKPDFSRNSDRRDDVNSRCAIKFLISLPHTSPVDGLYQSIVRLLSVRDSKARNWMISCYGRNRGDTRLARSRLSKEP